MVVQVMGLWLLAYIALGQLLVPAALGLAGVERAALGARATAALNLALDAGQVGLTLSILVRCLAGYRPRQAGLFKLAWEGGAWIAPVAAGAQCCMRIASQLHCQ